MFTGIVEELGTVLRMPPASRAGAMTIGAHEVLQGTRIGDSIAVNGVCLTVTRMEGDQFSVDVMPETLRASGLGQVHAGDCVNLERAMQADGRFGGHIVSGHIDGTGRVKEIKREQNAHIISIEAPSRILGLIVQKGSIAIDGVSLTVVDVTSSLFTVSIIPHTAQQTVLMRRKPGDVVNLENDIIGKYVQKLLGENDVGSSGGLTVDYLVSNGF